MAQGNTLYTEKISYTGWQKRFGRSVGLRAPGMFMDQLRRTTKLSQWCHGCGKVVKKPLSQRWHQCACGVGPVQRDLAPSPRECGRATPRCSAPAYRSSRNSPAPALGRASRVGNSASSDAAQPLACLGGGE